MVVADFRTQTNGRGETVLAKQIVGFIWRGVLGLGLLRSPSGYFKPLLDTGGGFTSKNAARKHQKRNGRHVTVSEAKGLQTYSG